MNFDELDFAYKVRHALNETLDDLPASTEERLASARKIALSRKRKGSPLRALSTQNALAGQIGNFFNEPLSWMTRIGVATPLLLGLVLFVGLYQYEQQQHISEMAELDAAVLSDELPLSAYLDHGFNAYLAKREE
jgi:Protein of unknown function (DUF3619)